VRDLIVVGAGAAGSWAAWRAAAAGVPDVLLLEKTPRLGTKILASGGSRCNLTTTLGPDDAGRLFRDKGARFLRRAFRGLPPLEVRELFDELGVGTEEAPLEKVFPSSGSAREVRDALQSAVLAAGVELRTGAAVERFVGLNEEGDAGPGTDPWGSAKAKAAGDSGAPEGGAQAARFELHLVTGEVLRCRQLVLACGGRSYASTGTTGDGYAWLESLGLEVTPTLPALVPLASPAGWVHDLSGIALQGAESRLLDQRGKEVARRVRPLLFTHAGLSGPGPMDLSVHVAKAVHERGGPVCWSLKVDPFPAIDREQLRDILVAGAGRGGAPRLLRILSDGLAPLLKAAGLEPIPKRLMAAFLAQAGLAEDAGHQTLGRAKRHELIEALKGLEVPISGTLGFDQAEVTTGGLALRHVEAGSCRVRGHAGLYVIGELLDLDGPIGGLNFQSAFATAELCAKDLVRG